LMRADMGKRWDCAAVEALQARVLLSIALDATTLSIVGTEGDDRIVVAANKRFINILTVGDNDEMRSFALAAISKIDIRAGGGNDKILIDSSLDALAYDCYVDGGAGNDSIYTSFGDDTILGGDGNDKIYSNYGYDSIDG